MENSNRRAFIKDSVALTAGTIIAGSAGLSALSACAAEKQFIFEQIKLPYAYNALEPFIDAQTMELHYSKHQTTYLKNVNEAIATDQLKYNSADDFFANTSKISVKARNNAGGVWNHNFFWTIMKPSSKNPPPSNISDAIQASFGSMAAFKEQFTKAAMDHFGSGWAWLTKDGDKLIIGSTANQDNPLMDNAELKGKPLLGLDVWEHAYYLKYQNERKKYVDSWFNVINWEQVSKNLS